MPTRKPISPKRLRESVVKSTMKTMSIEGRLPPHEPRPSTASKDSLVANFKSTSRQMIG